MIEFVISAGTLDLIYQGIITCLLIAIMAIPICVGYIISRSIRRCQPSFLYIFGVVLVMICMFIITGIIILTRFGIILFAVV